MKVKTVLLLACVASLFFLANFAASHCEIPCGIYDDAMRIDMIREHISTIEKSMTQITELQSTEVPEETSSRKNLDLSPHS